MNSRVKLEIHTEQKSVKIRLPPIDIGINIDSVLQSSAVAALCTPGFTIV